MVSFNPSRKRQLYRVNVYGTQNIVNAALINGVEKLGYVSSTAAIGKNLNGTTDEACEWSFDQNPSNYSISKYYAELEIWRGISEGLNAAIVNPSIILGAGNWNSGSNAIIRKVYDGLKFYTSGKNGFVNVRDVAQLLLMLMEKEIFNERFLVVSENLHYKELFEKIAAVFNVTPPHIEARKWQMNTIAFLENIRCKITRTEPLITKETIQSSVTQNTYNNMKIRSIFPDFQFTDIQTTLQETKNFIFKKVV
jgi:nucleoside-diphosphate-sugar epimerase